MPALSRRCLCPRHFVPSQSLCSRNDETLHITNVDAENKVRQRERGGGAVVPAEAVGDCVRGEARVVVVEEEKKSQQSRLLIEGVAS